MRWALFGLIPMAAASGPDITRSASGRMNSEAIWFFDGYTIPSRLCVGWHFGSERFAREGEFFRARIESAGFR